MTIQILMPALSPTMTEGKLAKWHVKEGDAVKSGQVICEIETDKATMEVEAVDEGTIGRILIAEGTEGVAVNTPIAILLEEGEDNSAIKAAPQAAPAKSPPTAAQGKSPPTAAPPPSPPATTPAATAAPVSKAPMQQAAKSAPAARVFASPLARRLASQHGIDVALLKGSGPHGRVVKADIDTAVKTGSGRPQAKTAAPGPAFGAPRESRLVPHTSVRKVIAKRLTEAKQQIPHIYVTVDCRLDALLDARKQINAKSDKIKVSVNDMIVKAAALALRDHPDVNASWTADGMLLHGTVDVSVAVASDRGLITPILRDADLKGLGALSGEMKDLAARAKDGKLKLDEFQGGGFTVSNLGMFGVREFAAIINPPQAAILAVGAGEQRAVVSDGAVKVATVMSVTLAADHRIVDGALAALWLQTFRGYIEQPATMLI